MKILFALQLFYPSLYLSGNPTPVSLKSPLQMWTLYIIIPFLEINLVIIILSMLCIVQKVNLLLPAGCLASRSCIIINWDIFIYLI